MNDNLRKYLWRMLLCSNWVLSINIYLRSKRLYGRLVESKPLFWKESISFKEKTLTGASWSVLHQAAYNMYQFEFPKTRLKAAVEMQFEKWHLKLVVLAARNCFSNGLRCVNQLLEGLLRLRKILPWEYFLSDLHVKWYMWHTTKNICPVTFITICDR